MAIGVMYFNPFNGRLRDPLDIKSDPQGLLIWDGETPLSSVPKPNPLWMTESLDKAKSSYLDNLIAGLEAKPDLNSYYDKLLDKAIALLKDQSAREKSKVDNSISATESYVLSETLSRKNKHD